MYIIFFLFSPTQIFQHFCIVSMMPFFLVSVLAFQLAWEVTIFLLERSTALHYTKFRTVKVFLNMRRKRLKFIKYE